jgi:hypothetical protein
MLRKESMQWVLVAVGVVDASLISLKCCQLVMRFVASNCGLGDRDTSKVSGATTV